MLKNLGLFTPYASCFCFIFSKRPSCRKVVRFVLITWDYFSIYHPMYFFVVFLWVLELGNWKTEHCKSRLWVSSYENCLKHRGDQARSEGARLLVSQGIQGRALTFRLAPLIRLADYYNCRHLIRLLWTLPPTARARLVNALSIMHMHARLDSETILSWVWLEIMFQTSNLITQVHTQSTQNTPGLGTLPTVEAITDTYWQNNDI